MNDLKRLTTKKDILRAQKLELNVWLTHPAEHYDLGPNGSNPMDVPGKITRFDEVAEWISVDWSNGEHNGYKPGELSADIDFEPLKLDNLYE